MKKILISLTLILVCLTVSGCNKQNGMEETKDYKNEQLTALIETTYKDLTDVLPMNETSEVTSDNYESTLAFKDQKKPTFLSNIESMVTSSAAMMSVAYSMTLIKVDEKADINAIKEEIINNVDMWKWICVGADVAYVNNYGSVIMVVMANEDIANKVYEKFEKATDNKLNEKLEKINEELNIEE